MLGVVEVSEAERASCLVLESCSFNPILGMLFVLGFPSHVFNKAGLGLYFEFAFG